ncbi:MAG: DUF262 domain-containing protein [Pseudomonadota bacterium]
MTLNSIIQTTRPTVTNIIDNMREKSFFVDDTFQRRLVWTERQKVRLIQTILMGYPMPEVYLWQQPADPDSGRQLHSIVDGQQRLTTMLQFTANEWSLSERYLDEELGVAGYADMRWKDVSAETKRRFWQYVVNVRTIPAEVSHDQIVDVFLRLNETDKSLNPQEMRNAEFNGEFIKAAERITESDPFKSLDIFTDFQIRRMGDIEFVSGLLMFLRRGLIEENTKSINETYDMYNDEYEEVERDISTVVEFLERCDRLYLESDETRKFFTRPVHLFSLFCVEQLLLERKALPENLSLRLDAFVQAYTSNEPDETLEKYREGASSRTRSRASRNARTKALSAKIVG